MPSHYDLAFVRKAKTGTPVFAVFEDASKRKTLGYVFDSEQAVLLPRLRELDNIAREAENQIKLWRSGKIPAETALDRIGSLVGPYLAKVKA